jgi:hypothetical protein
VRVLLVGAGTHGLAERLRALSPRVETVAVADAAEGEAHLGRVEVVVAGQRVRPAYAAAPGLRWLHLTGTLK